jgi:PPOX class probable F420-dependent enzyme
LAGVDDAAMRARVARARIGRLATVRADGTPHLVPCCFVLAGDTVYSAVDAKPKSTVRLQRLRNLETNAAAAIIVDHYDDDDWTALWWVRIDGTARVLDAGVEFESALDLLTPKYHQYRELRPQGPVIAIDAVRWAGWP